MSEYKQVAPLVPTIGPGQAQETHDPRRAPSVAADVLVPLLQALVSAALIAFVVAAMARILKADWDTVGSIAVLVFGVVLVAAWFWRLAWAQSTLERIESLLGADLNGDGYIPPHAYSINKTAGKRYDPVAFERARLQEFIAYAYDKGTDTPTLRGKFNDKEVARFRSLLMRNDVGAARWKAAHHNQGWEFVLPRDETLAVVGKLEWAESHAVRR